MDITFLEAQMPLTKKYTETEKHSYPNAFEFTSHTVPIKDLPTFVARLREHAGKGHCLLKSNPKNPLISESRAGSTNPNATTKWLCLDIDGLTSVSTIEQFMTKIGLGNVSYAYQYSASYGIRNDYALRAHVFILLRTAASPANLKLWLKHLNLTHFRTEIALAKSHASLRWGLDITTCQNDKLIFITPPECNPPTLNTFTEDRIGYVEKENLRLEITDILKMMPSPDSIRSSEETQINALRTAAGLPEYKSSSYKLKEYKGETYMPNPGAASVTGIKEERGFVYLNLNGGDSWGYYHPADKNHFIYNFKGEPTYRTSELLPDYWQGLQNERLNERIAKKQEHKDKTFLAFRDVKTSEYYNGWYDHQEHELMLHVAKSEKQVADFLIHYGQFVPETLPIWDVIYDPFAGPVSETNCTVNTFRHSTYMRKYGSKTKASKSFKHSDFPNTHRLISHVIGESMTEHFYNWLAFCFTKRVAPQTAWILHGTQGTGKGMLVNRIITPLFHAANVTMRRMEELEDKFNDYLEGSLIVCIDEAQISESGRNKVIMANLKNWITEPSVTIRRMRQSAYETINRTGWIFASNMPDPVVVAPNDRRFNVGEFQPRPLGFSNSELDSISAELDAFAQFLGSYEIDERAVRTPKMNNAKEQMIAVSRSSADMVADALQRGDLTMLWDALPTIDSSRMPLHIQAKLDAYKALIYDIISTMRTKLSRDELGIIFDFNVGNINLNAWKLTAYLRHHGIEIKDIRIGPSVVKGADFEWFVGETWLRERQAEIAMQAPIRLKAVK